MWAGSSFQWIKSRPSRQVGAIGEKLVSHWCVAKGLDVARSPDSETDTVLNIKGGIMPVEVLQAIAALQTTHRTGADHGLSKSLVLKG